CARQRGVIIPYFDYW
nr:immunoglobulin heavy chain junction region [Macaca mulatta]MOX92573.1 immunoglobulin heavy chain junction region [Macaca mulatta]MOX92617.1 immunoglobulin heavy chain junction region [Macaca mulatta]MOX92952.1 immunoglobulin heavy chain junction region [Macaca mulatta]MOX93028.1 immunoglobulin heavy chain junction region [Macaca mulatta]